jgi:uncharacterized protein (TIGR02145 family)
MLSNYLKKSEAITTGGVETDPVFNGSVAKGITVMDTSYWNKKLNTSDTSGMLANYRTRINNKLDAKDTTLMLSNYLKKSEAITTGGVETNPVFNGSIAKGITATDTSYWNRKLNTSDTVAISNRINSKLNISDFPRGVTMGNTIYWNGDNWVILAPGLPGQILSTGNDGKPIWINSIPMITTNTISGITTNSSSSGGNITSDGGATVSARGVVWSTSSSPTVSLSTKTIDGTGKGSFSSAIIGLSPNTTYYVRSYATNSVGTVYGNEITFTTNQVVIVPALVTTAVSSITTNSSSSGGNITSDGGATVSARGVVWSASSSPTVSLSTKTIDGTGIGSFSSAITGLLPNTTYYVRSYATNSVGTGYGNEITFTSTSQVVTDIDGNTYNTVQIGTQIWMSENLKTFKYRNGTAIPVRNTDWGNFTTGALCSYDNNEANISVYGLLYNWYTTKGDSLCPMGWHVPTEGEWLTLRDYLGGIGDVVGGKMKSTGTTYWNSPNLGATNESGFSALPGGWKNSNSRFQDIRNRAYFWSASGTQTNTASNDSSNAWQVSLDTQQEYFAISGNNLKSYGLSIRCLKN